MTATLMYKNRQEEVNDLVKQLRDHLTDHAKKQTGDERNYGYAADLEYIRSLLKTAVHFIEPKPKTMYSKELQKYVTIPTE